MTVSLMPVGFAAFLEFSKHRPPSSVACQLWPVAFCPACTPHSSGWREQSEIEGTHEPRRTKFLWSFAGHTQKGFSLPFSSKKCFMALLIPDGDVLTGQRRGGGDGMEYPHFCEECLLPSGSDQIALIRVSSPLWYIPYADFLWRERSQVH
jgi:hypothetical protein